jgi:hypothetical protein
MTELAKRVLITFVIGTVIFVIGSFLYNGFAYKSFNDLLLSFSFYQLYAFVLGFSNMMGFIVVGGGPTLIGVSILLTLSDFEKASSNASDKLSYLLLFTEEIEYITTKKANNKVIKSAYETSQRSWLLFASSKILFLLRFRVIYLTSKDPTQF